MKRKCECGKVHEFTKFRNFKTTFGGTTSHYQHFCKKLKRLMILTTTTYPPNLTGGLCPSTALKKFTKLEVLQPSEVFIESGLYMQSAGGG